MKEYLKHLATLKYKDWLGLALLLSMVFLILQSVFHFWVGHPNRALLELNLFSNITGMMLYANKDL